MADKLGLKPIVTLDLRLGEGTGAAIGIFIAETSARLLAEMSTFGEAGVSEKEE
jgi:nicotinate-nucleotide--dimethylbenzimidazole phosphoribosyltransferase